MIGLDVRYGNQTFIEPGQNGYLLEYTGKKDQKRDAVINEYGRREVTGWCN